MFGPKARRFDMRGRTVLVTGANSGLGKASVLELAAMGAHVVMACRSEQRAQAAAEDIVRQVADARLEIRTVDLASFRSVRDFARRFVADHGRLDVLMNNAGLISDKRQVTVDGFESTLQVNHLGHFLLTHLLRDLLVASAPARVIHIASLMHHFSRGDLDNLQLQRGWRPFRAYNLSKLLNVLFSMELARQLEGFGVTSNAVHPGGVATNWGFGHERAHSPLKWVTKAVLRSPIQGAATQIWLASDPAACEWTGGYYANSRKKRPSRVARDVAKQRRLWELSEQMVGIV